MPPGRAKREPGSSVTAFHRVNHRKYRCIYIFRKRMTYNRLDPWEGGMRVVEAVRFARFEWDAVKERFNVAKHGIDFDEALIALSQPHLEARSDRNGEVRVLAICPHSNHVIAVVYTPRGEACRIISARRARKNEQREYRLHYT